MIFVPLKDQSLTQSAWVVEYTDCIFAELVRLLNECPGYETEQSDGGSTW